jgi:arylsulfatase A-like enzyme
MTSPLNRREFIKLTAALSAFSLLDTTPWRQVSARLQAQDDLPNVIILLFDAMSARHLSLYGYQRNTTPNLDKWAEHASVYHAHHSAGNFTTPSTASLFTGTYPWGHRAFALSSLVSSSVADRNLFRLLDTPYYEWAFAQNPHADILLYQFEQYLDRHDKLDTDSILRYSYYNNFFTHDAIAGFKSFDDFLFKQDETHGSLFFSFLHDLDVSMHHSALTSQLSSIYPDGLPHPADVDVYFITRQVFDGIIQRMQAFAQPTFNYLHFFPPHGPYSPTREFLGKFDDGWAPPGKERHPLALNLSDKRLNRARQEYDEYIANIDVELGRLFEHMQAAGIFDNSYVFITADHGELFERGVLGHFTPVMFEPLINIPLVVFSPGQTQRKDIYENTTNIDLLPTLLHIAGMPLPEWAEGQVLPGLGGVSAAGRSIYSLDAKKNPSHAPITKGSLALLKDQFKIVHYFGYDDYTAYEFYDLKNDPEELENLYPSHPAAAGMQAEMDLKLQQVNLPYYSSSR